MREVDDLCLHTGATSFRLVGGAAPVAATRHWFLELRWWWKKQA
jgi:hypothetical protein